MYFLCFLMRACVQTRRIFSMVTSIIIGLNVLYKQEKSPNRLERKIAKLIKLRTERHRGLGGKRRKRNNERQLSSDVYLSVSIE